MPYVRIPDPNIIDLTAWNEVISVVNQHSDSIAALTNDFGINYEPVWEGEDNYSVQYDSASQKIIYGRAKMLKTTTPVKDDNNHLHYLESVSFITPFSQPPTVTATILIGGAQNSFARNYDAIVATYNVGASGFNYRITRPVKDSELLYDVWINWIAIGAR